VLWADVRDGWDKRLARGENSHPALQDAIEDVFNARIGDVSGRGKLAGDMREIWLMQPRFEKRTGSTPFGLAEQPRFRAAFDFMRLRADAGEVDEALADWWQEFSMASDDMRQDMVDQVRAEMQQKPRAPRVHLHLRLCLQVQVQVQFPNRLLNMRPVQSLVTPMPPASVVAVVAQVLPKVRQAEPVVVRPARHPDQTRHVQTHCRTRYSLHRSGC
jgi:hypothetical protein